MKEVGDSNVVLTFTGWVNQNDVNFLKARGEAIRTAKTALEDAGFGLPEPIYRVRLDDSGNPAAEATGTDPKTAAPQPRQPVRSADLPDAADPTRREDPTTEAAARERAVADGEDNLLDATQKAE